MTARGYAQRGTGDSIAPPAATDLPGGGGMVFSFIQRTYTLAPSEGAGHRVLLVYAIPARRLGGTERGEPILARVRLSLIATPEDTVVLTDTVRVLQELATAEDQIAEPQSSVLQVIDHDGRETRLETDAGVPGAEVEAQVVPARGQV
ncbi:MAG: hypothetical protein V3R71_01080, partial [Gemmatimonadales bacterium]